MKGYQVPVDFYNNSQVSYCFLLLFWKAKTLAGAVPEGAPQDMCDDITTSLIY